MKVECVTYSERGETGRSVLHDHQDGKYTFMFLPGGSARALINLDRVSLAEFEQTLGSLTEHMEKAHDVIKFTERGHHQPEEGEEAKERL